MNTSTFGRNKWIFLIPVDGNTNKNINQREKELPETVDNKINNKEKEQTKQNIENLNKEFLNNSPEKNFNIKIQNENKNNFPAISYSIISKSKDFSIADSSKFYMSECLKKNWKIRIKRLIIKLKKRYTKQAKRFFLEDPKFDNNEDICSIENNNNKIKDDNIYNHQLNFEINNNKKNFTNCQNNYDINNSNINIKIKKDSE